MIRALLLLIAAALLTAPAFAAAGSVRGRVTAENGKPLRGVAVSLAGPVHRSTVTGTDGDFFLPQIPAGTYTLTFRLAQFATARTRGIAVSGAPITLPPVQMHPSLTTMKIIGSVVARERLPFNNTPAAIKVFPREAYRDQGQASLSTVLEQTPGAIVAKSSGELNAQPMSWFAGTVRGGLPWETAMLVDGNPVTLPSSGTLNLAYVPSFVLQDVEIVKGYGAAETTLFGAEDGALNLRTAEPGGVLKGMLEVERDNRGGQFSDFAYGGTSKDQRFSFATMFSVNGNPGPNPALGFAGAALERAEMLKARYQFTDDTQLTATYLGSQGVLGVTQARGFLDASHFASIANGADVSETHRLGLYALELHHDSGADHLTAKAYSLQLQRTGAYDPFAFPAIGSGIDGTDGVSGISLQDDRQTGSSLYQLQLTHDVGTAEAAPLIVSGTRIAHTMLRAAAKLRAGASTDAQLAAAWLHDDSRFSTDGKGFTTRAFDTPVVHGGLAFHVRSNVTARVSAGTGAQAPTASMLSGISNPIAQMPVGFLPHMVLQTSDPAIAPERSFGYDAGVEYRLHGDTTTLSADAYHTVIHGAFFDPSVANGTVWDYRWMNASPMTHEGVEVSLQQFKRVGLGFITQASLVRTFSDSGAQANLESGPPLAPGQGAFGPLTVPYAQGYAEISYKWRRGSRASLGMLYLGANNPYRRPAFAQFNANLELSLNDYSKLQFSVQNLTGVYADRLGEFVNAPLPYVAGTVGPPTIRFMFRQSIGGSLFEH